jgi:isocitrate lyase
MARRFEGIVRAYTEADVERLRGSIRVEHTLAQMGARRLWELLVGRWGLHGLAFGIKRHMKRQVRQKSLLYLQYLYCSIRTTLLCLCSCVFALLFSTNGPR